MRRPTYTLQGGPYNGLVTTVSNGTTFAFRVGAWRGWYERGVWRGEPA